MDKSFNETPLDAEEKELMEAINSDDFKPEGVSSIPITLRFKTKDIQIIKEKAKNSGIPYQTLINSIIHRYATGEISFKEPL